MNIEILSLNDQIYEVVIHTRERDLYNRIIPRRSLVTIKTDPRKQP